MRNRMYGGVRGRKTKVGRKLLRFPPTRFDMFVRSLPYRSEITLSRQKKKQVSLLCSRLLVILQAKLWITIIS